VRALDAAGNAGDWSVQRSVNITTPLNAAPIPNSYSTGGVLLSWGQVSGASAYQVEVDDSATFTSPLVFSFTTTDANQRSVMTSALANGTYYWRVRARNAANIWGAWSPAASFVVDVP